jgi:tRNA1Val (adenine37-N6)-methyltransferase
MTSDDDSQESQDYRQPDFFRFGSDSLTLVKYVLSRVANRHWQNALDCGAGCGVVLLEIAAQIKFLELCFLEPQYEFMAALKENISVYHKKNPHVICHVVQKSLGEFTNLFKSKKKFDLIVSNPPYYEISQGRVSPDVRRAQAHHFVLESWESWLKNLKILLTDEGEIYFCTKNFSHTADEFIERHGLKITSKIQRQDLYVLGLKHLHVE